MVIPETGLLLEPTIPTIREDTVAKKKPKITTKAAPIGLIGITGTITIKAANNELQGKILISTQSGMTAAKADHGLLKGINNQRQSLYQADNTASC